MNNSGDGSETGNVMNRVISMLQSVRRSPGDMKAGKRKVLAERARILAQTAEPEKGEGAEKVQVLEFLIGSGRYGIDTAFVDEVVTVEDITPLPGTPPFVLGLFSYGGKIFALNDIREVIGTADEVVEEFRNGIIVSGKGAGSALAVGGILGIVSLRKNDIGKVHSSGPGNELLLGIAGDTVIMDIEKILKNELLIVR